MTLKFDGWPWKTTGHLLCTTSSFVHHFKPNGEFKLELQSRNAKFGSKLAFSVLCDFEIWWMTLKKYRAPLLCYFKLCKCEFKLEWQSGNAQFGSKSALFVPSDLEIWWMTSKKGAPLLCYFKIWASFHIAICEFKLELQSKKSQFGSKSIMF